MKFAIIAAGEGSRLAQEGISAPKPLVKVGGEALIERLLRIFHQNGAEETVVVVNKLHPETEAFVRQLKNEGQYGKITLVVQTTPSSMHSFHAISSYLGDAPFCLTTVDTIFREEEFAQYIRDFATCEADGVMAVTDYVDDEKPLYVATDAEMNITAFNDANCGDQYISGGIYALSPRALFTLHRCMAEGQSRMRNFQRGLIQDGLHLRAYPFSKILDIDHAEDIQKAEAFLAAREG
jgi:NDP-sugar pyrophosphorylase family protein